ncbi:MAG TPA: GNAT family N-acetyltransferase [Candidatus Limnocylindrales bacterium]|nr:GNAT family N-acetyltransferase [Candidatus Limnocylindrales bacterium]
MTPELSRVDIQAAADRNFVASFQKLVEHNPAGSGRDVGGAYAFGTGLPIGLFNGCVVTRAVTPEALAEAIEWVAGAGVPFRVWVRTGLPAQLAAVPPERGLVLHPRPYPGMALHPIPQPPPPSGGVKVRRVVDSADLAEHRAILVAGGATADVTERLLPPTMLADSDMALLTASLDGRPAGTALAIRSGATVGVYNVGTLPAARRRGVGSAATWAAVAVGLGWGCELAVLQSSDMGQSVYEAMGFRTVVRYLEFRQPVP